MLLWHPVDGAASFECAWGDPGKIIAPACPILGSQPNTVLPRVT
jgi:hypothetical protein